MPLRSSLTTYFYSLLFITTLGVLLANGFIFRHKRGFLIPQLVDQGNSPTSTTNLPSSNHPLQSPLYLSIVLILLGSSLLLRKCWQSQEVNFPHLESLDREPTTREKQNSLSTQGILPPSYPTGTIHKITHSKTQE